MITDLSMFAVFLVLLLVVAWPLGRYLAKVYSGEKTIFDRVLNPIAKIIYRKDGVNKTSNDVKNL